jgi:hypothetical protein
MFDETVFKYRGFKSMMRKFSFPDIQPGTIVEYICRHQYGTMLMPSDEWKIQSELYTRLGVFVLRPFFEAGLGWRQHGLPPGVVPEKQKDGSYRLEIHDFPAVKQEAYMPPEKVSMARVGFYNRFAPFPANETAAEYWNLVAKLWSKDVEKFINKRDFLEKTVAQTVSSSDPPEVKLRKLYSRAQQIPNLDYEPDDTTKKPRDLKPNDSVEDVLKHGYGTSKQINYVFIGLARAAGFDASSLAFTPRDEDFLSPNLQDSRQLTADLVGVRLGSDDRYLDPGNPYFPYGLLPWYASEVQGIRLEPGGGAVVVTAPPLSSDATLLRHADLQLDTEGSVSGKLQIDFAGQTACITREKHWNEPEDARTKGLSELIEDWLPPNSTFEITSVTGASANAVPLRVEGILRIPGYATVATNRMLVPVTPFRASQVQNFQSAARVNPIYLPYPYQEQDDISLKLPPGYRVEAMPRGEKTPKSLVEFDLVAHLNVSTVQVNRQLVVDAYSFLVTAYPSLRTFFQSVASADEQQVVLTNALAPAQ